MIAATSRTAPRVPDAVSSLAEFASAGVFGNAELHGAAVLVRADPAAPDSVHLAAALALWAPLHGHACIDLGDAVDIVGHALVADTDDAPTSAEAIDQPAATHIAPVALPWPAIDDWLAALSLIHI